MFEHLIPVNIDLYLLYLVYFFYFLNSKGK